MLEEGVAGLMSYRRVAGWDLQMETKMSKMCLGKQENSARLISFSPSAEIKPRPGLDEG
jgi:hypothetical protein